jgi:hypothetical protein
MTSNNNDDNISVISDNNSFNNCSICISNLKNTNNLHTLNCSHVFHKNCINEWLTKQNTCPMCRAIVNTQLVNIKPLNISLPPLPQINFQNFININAPHIIPSHPNNSINFKCWKNIKINKDKIIKYISMIFFILTCTFHLASSIYNNYVFFKTNNHINKYIKTLNETQLGDHNHNTYDVGVLIAFDIFYYFLFIIINIFLFKKKNCCCGNASSFVFLAILLITNLIVRSEFIRTTNDFLKDDNLNFESSYYDNLMLSSVLFYSSCGLKFFISMVSYINILA